MCRYHREMTSVLRLLARSVCGFALAVAGAAAGATTPEPFTVPFDFSRSSIGVDVTVRGEPLYVLLDTGVDPSLIDLERAKALGLAIDLQNGGEPSGFGDGKGATIFPSAIEGLAIAGHAFAPVEALASDMSALSAHYGRKLDGVLGYSFLKDKIVLIDYPQRTLSVLAHVRDVSPGVRGCRTQWRTPLRTSEGYPVIRGFRFGRATGRLTLDTGSNGGITLYQSALGLDVKTYTFNAAVGFGPFTLPAGQVVMVRSETGSTDSRVANGGNLLFAAMKLKILLDYRQRSMTFYGDCG
jgi:hypothetical protein